MSKGRWPVLLLLVGMAGELSAFPTEVSIFDFHPTFRFKREVDESVGELSAYPTEVSLFDFHPTSRIKRELNETTDEKALRCILLPDSCDSNPDTASSLTSLPPPTDPPPTPPPSPPQTPLPPSGSSSPQSPPSLQGTPPPHKPCICVPHWQCRSEKPTSVVTGNTLTSIVLDLRSASTGRGCGAPEEVCCLDIDEDAPPPTPLPMTFSCGQRNILGVSNTFLGFEDRQSQFGEFPWTVAIITSRNFGVKEEPLFLGGGSLIHPQVVMSVAHKFPNYTADKLKVRLGDWNLEAATEAVPHQDIDVAEVVMHPAYSGDPFHYHDVVLLVLQRPAVLGPTVNTICLPLTRMDYLPDKCVVSGWGTRDFSKPGRFQEVMKAVTMPLVEHAACQTALQGTRLGPGFLLHHSFLCAGGKVGGQDACTGDGGSPLVCPLRSDSSRYVQVGVVSWGIECGLAGVPGVYADVLRDGLWIDRVLNDKFGSSRKMEAARKPLVDVRTLV